MESTEPLVHVFMVSFPGQGHVNPLLRLGKRLAAKGPLVTFTIPENIGRQMRKANKIVGGQLNPVGVGFLRFEFFEDGWGKNDAVGPREMDSYMKQLAVVGKEAVSRMIKKNGEEGRPVSCLVNNPFIPWVSDVAAALGLPSAVLWVQSAASFSIYYHFHRGLVRFPTESNPEIDVQVPGLPVLKWDEVPSFLHPTTPYTFLRRAILGQYENLDKPFCVLMDTFEELEPDAIAYMKKYVPNIKPVGPLFRNPMVPATAVRGDFVAAADSCLTWLDTKPVSSVVYVSFGSVVRLKQEQVDEIAFGLLSSKVRFIWVMKLPGEDTDDDVVLPEGFREAAGEDGLVVEWSPQERLLNHPSVAAFLTHCGWNSSIEALACGVPVIAFPQWGDQVMDAKFLVDVFKVGIRMCRGEAENKLITRDEVEKGLMEATVGETAEEMRRNAFRWKKAAEAAVAEGGSSDRKLQDFVDEVTRKSIQSAASTTELTVDFRV